VLDHVIVDCINRLRSASVTQPITSIDGWWEWCNRSPSCALSNLAGQVDWIGINVFPWWENKFSGIFTCTTARQAPGFHIARLRDVMQVYPNKHVMLTEFGWPGKPRGATEVNRITGESCGVASERNQTMVIQRTLAKLKKLGFSGTVLGAFREPWKTADEAPIGAGWGLCGARATYTCKPGL
jgi:exo-beta-1,3-glucanase (GH17 family)